TFDRDLTGCCCSTDNCNTKGTNINTTIPIQPPEDPIACFSGITINNVVQNGGGTLLGGQGCSTLPGDRVITGCCCDGSNSCNVAQANATGVYCNGMCSSLSGLVNGDNVTTFQCVPRSVCKSLAVDNACASLPGDREVTGCCCDYKNSCSLELANITDITPPTPPSTGEFPLSCWSGIYVNNVAITNAGYQTCQGECASVTLQTTLNSQQHNATIYLCDPTTICQSLNMTNQCSTVEAGLSGCCCNTDACLSPRRSPDNPLVCYVGLYAPKAKVNVGAEVSCSIWVITFITSKM
ncbi:unnamed protein product, partial [Nippostrongylus brasiliensis]|uniref:ET module n=1 Tax=Nippostrongylus brasiliensis TaxID=27835 RepID=A0A0N4YWF7_NIPBR